MITEHKDSYEIACDVPGCDETKHIAEFSIITMRERVDKGRMNAIVRRHAENFNGWFLEAIRLRSTKVLLRDICGFHAPSYRSLLATQTNGTRKET